MFEVTDDVQYPLYNLFDPVDLVLQTALDLVLFYSGHRASS
jgi:hypothetical protein